MTRKYVRKTDCPEPSAYQYNAGCRCPGCRKISRERQARYRGQRRAETNPQLWPHICPICRTPYQRLKVLDNHVARTHPTYLAAFRSINANIQRLKEGQP